MNRIVNKTLSYYSTNFGENGTTVNPLLLLPYFFSSTFEGGGGGLNREGSLKETGVLI